MDLQRCIICNNLDPRGHKYSVTDVPHTYLYLQIMPEDLRQSSGSCRFCHLLLRMATHFTPLPEKMILQMREGSPTEVLLFAESGDRMKFSFYTEAYV
jgi:hypothetical protein